MGRVRGRRILEEGYGFAPEPDSPRNFKYRYWDCGVLHRVLFTALCISDSAWVLTDRFRTHFSITSSFFSFQYRRTHSRDICGSKVLWLSGKVAVKSHMPFFIENNITIGEICNMLREVWGDAKRLAEGSRKNIRTNWDLEMQSIMRIYRIYPHGK